MKIIPTNITYSAQTARLQLSFNTQESFELTAEYLRVHSPSAEVQGHAKGQEVLQLHKEAVKITAIEGIGNYAIKITFDDGHNTGIYTWDTLYSLCKNQASNWQAYQQACQKALKNTLPQGNFIQLETQP